MTHLVGAAAAGDAVVVAAGAVVGTALASAAATSVTTRRGPAAVARANRCNVLRRVAVAANCGCKTGLGTASSTKAALVQNTLQTSFPLVVGEAVVVVVVVVWREFETARVVDAVAGPTC